MSSLVAARMPAAAVACCRLAVALILLACVFASPLVVAARAESGLKWRSEPAQAPPSPPGVAPAPYPVPLGHVGQISFWAPNRGLLITGGTEEAKGSVAAGLYAYDGESWHQLSTECGGAEGRIAWAGPDEFWTISDQRPGQVLAPGQASGPALRSVSLCHFLDGQIVGSYAMPLEEPDSYRPMDAAACYSPSDCWFGGENGLSPNTGAFHLHWNGSTVSAIYAPEDHVVTSMTVYDGQLYEGVQIGEHDTYLPSESTEHPAVIHTIAPGGRSVLCGGVESQFCDLTIFAEGELLPEYGKGVPPDALQGFDLATDGSASGAGATQLWAAAGPTTGGAPNSARVTVLHDREGNWSQVIPNSKGESPLGAGTTLAGAGTGTSDAIAPEPGGESAWLSLAGGGARGVAELVHLDGAGTLSQPSEPVTLPEADEPVGYRGEAGPIVCPAADDCWMATVDETGPTPGWLFHLCDGAPLPHDTDPFFDGEDGVISYRPPDSGVEVLYPIVPPADDSLINQQHPSAASSASAQELAGSTKVKRAKPLVTHLESKFRDHHVLVISFTLTAKAHVQLLGRRHSKVVASTRKESLRPGRHVLSLSLNPAAWPEKLQFEATPIGKSAPSGGGEAGSGSSSSSGGDTVST